MSNRRSRSGIPGSRFNPTDLELINYLRRRIERNQKSSYITDMNVYEKEPWLLQHVTHPKFKKNIWFYFVTRKKPPRIKKIDSKRTSRVVGSCRWKTTGLLTDLNDEDGVKVGSTQSIIFKAKIKGKKDEINTGWVMHEFLLNKPGFQEVVLCKIRFKQDKNNAQYAPRLEPIVIGDTALVPREEDSLVKRKEQEEEDFKNPVSLIDFGEGAEQGMDLPQLPMEFQEPWFGSCSSVAVSYSAAQHQQIMGQDSSYLMNGCIEQQQDFGSCGQQQTPILGQFSLMEPQQHYGQGFGDMAHEYLNQNLGQETDPWQVPMMNQALNGYFGPYSAQPYLGQDMALMTQGMMVHQEEQHISAQYQQLSMNGTEQHQGFGSCGQFVGESLGQQENQFLVQQATILSPLEQQQWNGYPGPYLAQPYDQGMVPLTQGMTDHQEFGFSSLCMAQNDQYFGQNNDLSMVPMETQQGMEPQQHDSCFNHNNVVEDLAARQQHLGQDSNLLLTQQQQPNDQKQLWGQNMNQALEEQHCGQVVPESAQPNLGQNIDLPKLTMETQQKDNVVGNLPAQLQLETNQETVLPINQGIDEPRGGHCDSSTFNKLIPQSFDDETAFTNHEFDSMIADFRNEEWAQKLGVNTPEEEAELMDSLQNCNIPHALLNYFCPI